MVVRCGVAERFRYIDGNNNAYVIDTDRVVYEPISPAQSSSGTYSGGEPAAASLTRDQLAAITALIDHIIADTKNHLATRPKGCGTIVRDDLRISFESPLRAELERALKAALNGA
jgi:hypothetical protein